MKPDKSVIPKYWLGKDKLKISCKEKIKVLNNNIDELQEMISDIYDEAILIGIDEKQLKEVLIKIVKNIKNNLKMFKSILFLFFIIFFSEKYLLKTLLLLELLIELQEDLLN